MEKVNKYQQIIRRVLENHLRDSIANMPEVRSELIIDEAEHHFILLDIGWNDKKYIHEWVFHIEIKDNKIWIHEDLTDTGIAKELVENDIPESDIILAFVHPPSKKHLPSTV